MADPQTSTKRLASYGRGQAQVRYFPPYVHISKCQDFNTLSSQSLSLLPDPNDNTSRFNHLDPIFKHSSGGCIYVGNQTAASDLSILTKHGITHVVNCTSGAAKIPDFHRGKVNYLEFPISFWNQHVDSTDASVLKFADNLFSFIDSALEAGHSVLVHCLAGAHRAGTTGCACLMHYAGLPARPAIIMAKKCRSIIDPIGMLPEFLMRLERAKSSNK